MTRSVSVKDLVQGIADLEVTSGEDYLDRKIKLVDVSRPALELTGYFNFYPQDRIQLLGRTEISFMRNMSRDEKYIILKKLCHDDTPAFVVTRDQETPAELIEVAGKNNIPILKSKKPTTRISASMTNFLEEELAERQSFHGVLVDIYGMGVLIMGDSGIGKSETALELIKRGHRLIADDRVELYMMDESRIIGEPPEILRNLIEIRGIGMVDVVNLFGVGAVRPSQTVDLVIYLEHWDQNRQYERIGNSLETMRVFNVDLPKLSIPVRVGRNLAIIIELAAMNNRAKNMGYDSLKAFEQNLTNLISKNSVKESNETDKTN